MGEIIMKNDIVVVGGYGHVGKMICRDLGELYPGKVYAAGRSFSRAEQFSRSTNGKVRPLELNIKEAGSSCQTINGSDECHRHFHYVGNGRSAWTSRYRMDR